MPEIVAPVTPPPATPSAEVNGATPPAAGEAPPVTPPPPKEDPMGKRFAALSRKERELLTERQAIAAEKAALAAEKESHGADKTKMQKLVSAVAAAKENPMAVLQEAGITYDQLTKYILNDGKASPEDRIAELDQKIENERLERIRSEEARELAKQKADDDYIVGMIDEYRKETEAHISSDPAAYELILAYDAQNEVFSLIRDHFAATGKVLSPEDAAKQVEADLEKTIDELIKLGKVQAKLKPPEPEPKKTEPPKTNVRPVPKTLSTKHVSAPTPAPANASLSRDERLKRAMGKLVFTDR